MISKRAALALVLLLSACDQKKPAPDAANASSTVVAPGPPLPNQPAPSIGVPECDDYFKLAFRCTAKLPPDLRSKAQSSILLNVSGWSALAQTPANRADLVQQCTKVLEALRSSPSCK